MALYQKFSSPTETYTLEQFILMKNSDTMTYSNFSIFNKIDEIKVLDHNLIDDYIRELESLCKVVSLTDEEYKKYIYAPDLLAYDLYGSVQLDFIILAANDIIDPKDFNLKRLKLPPTRVLKQLLTEIYNSNSSYISRNRQIINEKESL